MKNKEVSFLEEKQTHISTTEIQRVLAIMEAFTGIIGAKCKSNSPSQVDFTWKAFLSNNSLDFQYEIYTQKFLVIISGLVNSGYLFYSLYFLHL